LKNSDLRDDLIKSARSFASQESHLQLTAQMLMQINQLTSDIEDKIQRLEVSIHEIPTVCELLKETNELINLSQRKEMSE